MTGRTTRRGCLAGLALGLRTGQSRALARASGVAPSKWFLISFPLASDSLCLHSISSRESLEKPFQSCHALRQCNLKICHSLIQRANLVADAALVGNDPAEHGKHDRCHDPLRVAIYLATFRLDDIAMDPQFILTSP